MLFEPENTYVSTVQRPLGLAWEDISNEVI